MFVHYGCAILKHEANQSDMVLKLSLIVKLICAVLIMRASYIVNYWDLLIPLIAFAASSVVLSLYLWAHGITFIDAGKRVSRIKFRDLWKSIKDTF
jgi:hypothetical protein